MDLFDVIPPDDLHWIEDDQKLAAVSDEQLSAICAMVARLGGETDLAVAVVSWATQAMVDFSLLRGIISGRVGARLADDGELRFFPMPQ